MSQALDRIRQVSRRRRKERFTALFHHFSPEMLRTAFFALRREAAPGVDGLTWRAYAADLDHRVEDLRARVQRGAYRALPSRRRYIPKADGNQRALAVAALEDKIVQRAPRRSQHDALNALVVGISSRKVNYILDPDIQSFFEAVTSWASPSSAATAVGAASWSNGRPAATACEPSSRRSRRRCDGGGTSRSPSRGSG